MTYSIIGVTGHIDHGKTTLVRRLTGVDTDTQPEEKRRGITIDLGFAAFQFGNHRFAMIDAPGHQKYIGNLLVGVSAIDIGLLVVAGDQGIQEQTLEHAAIVQALGLKKLVVAVSRIDLVNEERIAELVEELDVFLADFGFSEIPILPISSLTGRGIDQLIAQFCAYARPDSATVVDSPSGSASPFRMPIDRAFVVPGRGLVVAGTVWCGQVHIGDMLEVAATGELMRVRELEIHGELVDSSHAGFRTAINLAGTSNSPIERGDELITPRSFPLCSRLVLEMQVFADAHLVRCPATVQMHTATQACEARVLGVKQLVPGESSVVVIEPERPILASHLQSCLFRLPYPIGSIAGGRVLVGLSAGTFARTKDLVFLGERLKSSEWLNRLAAWIDFVGEFVEDPHHCAVQLGIPVDQFRDLVEQCCRSGIAIRLGNRLVSMQAAERACQAVMKQVESQSHQSASSWMVQPSIIDQCRKAGSAMVVQWAIDRLVEQERLVRLNNLVAIASGATILTKKQRAAMERIASLYCDNRSPPTVKELAKQLDMSIDSVTSLVRFAVQQQTLVDLGQGFLISRDVLMELCRELKSLFDTQGSLSVSTIRDSWQVTRKHAIPLLEYCDREGITNRRETLRLPGPNLLKSCCENHAVEHSVE